MKNYLICTFLFLTVAMVGCIPKAEYEKGSRYIDTLHRSWLEIEQAVTEDASLTQSDLNDASGIAVMLAREEANYWSNRLAAQGIAVPAWEKRLEEISKTTSEFEGGSAVQLSKNMEFLDFLRNTVDELRKLCKN